MHPPRYHIGHFLNRPDRPIPLLVGRLEDLPDPVGVRYPHCHAFYELLWVESGSSRHRIDHREFAITPNTLFVIAPGQWHEWEDWHDDVRGWVVLFTEDFFRLSQLGAADLLFALTYLDSALAEPALPLDTAAQSALRPLLTALTAEYGRASGAAESLILRGLLLALLGHVQRAYRAGRATSVAGAAGSATGVVGYAARFRELTSLLETRVGGADAPAPWHVSDLAAALHCTSRHLNRVCQAVAGRPASEVVQARVVLEAQRRLAYSAASVAEVAAGLGFADSSYFARFFRRATGAAPLDWRRAVSEKYPKSAVPGAGRP